MTDGGSLKVSACYADGRLTTVTVDLRRPPVAGLVIEKCRGLLVDRGRPLAAPEAPRPQAWLAALRDPCLPWRVEVGHA